MANQDDFAKFRQQKINEREVASAGGEMVFGGGIKKKDDDGPKKIKLSDLKLPGNERPEDAPPRWARPSA